MKNNNKNFRKNDAAFTGLEAAIVLIAFVVVAAVFSYVMLGAGFFTSQKAQQTVHTGVGQATSSLEITGNVIGTGANGNLTGVMITVELTAGNNPIDLNKTVIAYQGGSTIYNPSVFDGATDTTWIVPASGHPTNLLSQYEKAQLTITFDADEQVGPNTQIVLSIAPAQGAVLPVTVTTPPSITDYMTLY
jgi:archaeal flagellin FlaB